MTRDDDVAELHAMLSDARALLEDCLPSLRMLATEQARTNKRLTDRGLSGMVRTDHIDRAERADEIMKRIQG
jgi:hypothetical protein